MFCSNQLIIDLMTTRKSRKLRLLSKKSLKDHSLIEQRMQINGVKIDYVGAVLESIYGRRYTVEDMLCLARKIAKLNKFKIDRLAHRNRDALLCWYAENWEYVYPVLFNNGTQNTGKISPKSDIQETISENQLIDPSDISQLLNKH